MYVIPEWPASSPIWANENLNLLLADTTAEPPDTTLKIIKKKSKNFPVPFPIKTVRCKKIQNTVSKKVLNRNINSAYPVLHEKVLILCANFLLYKRKFGNAPERELYANMSLLQFIDRFLSKRAVTFLCTYDRYHLLDGTMGCRKWETIGTDAETATLNLGKCLSYDELKLSALLSVSSYTHFLNDGNRYNKGVVERKNVENEGIIIGQIGTRFEKTNLMEHQDVIITQEQNNENNGYGMQFAPTIPSLFSGFYDEACFTYTQALERMKEEPTRFTEIKNGVYFDNNIYCKRISLSIDTLLMEANQRAEEKGTTAFVYAVGLGLGAWKISPHQNSLYLDVFAKRILALGENLRSVSDVVLAYIGDENATSGGYKNGDVIPITEHPKGGIKIYISQRQPYTKLTGNDKGKLLVASYAWDGNALPGNEFWCGSLSGSGDPAAASSTQVAELHNPHINPKVCGENLRIACSKGVVSFLKYREIVKRSQYIVN